MFKELFVCYSSFWAEENAMNLNPSPCMFRSITESLREKCKGVCSSLILASYLASTLKEVLCNLILSYLCQICTGNGICLSRWHVLGGATIWLALLMQQNNWSLSSIFRICTETLKLLKSDVRILTGIVQENLQRLKIHRLRITFFPFWNVVIGVSSSWIHKKSHLRVWMLKFW